MQSCLLLCCREGQVCEDNMMKRLWIVASAAALAAVAAEAAPKRTAQTRPQGTIGAAALISEAECRKIHGGLFLTGSCRSGAACRTTSVNGDGQVEYHDECLIDR